MNRRLALAALAGLAAGCASGGPTFELARTSSLVGANYEAADILVGGAQHRLAAGQPIIVATLVRMESLGQSSNLGRLISEHIGSRLIQRGYNVPELKLRGTIFVQSTQGELMLSRDLREIAASHHAQAVVVGTYAVANNYVYVNVKLIEAGGHATIAAHNYLLPYTGEIKALTEPRARSHNQ